MHPRIRAIVTLGIYVVVGCVLFYRLLGAGFVTDFLGWLECQQDTPFHLLFQCFGVKGLYFVPYTLLYALTALFGMSSWPWWIVFAGGHIVNAFLVTKLMRATMSLFDMRSNAWLPFLAGLIFLVHPYQVEVVAWKACINYIASCFLVLAVLWLYVRYLSSGSKRALGGSVAAYVFMLFTLEFALMVPVVLLLLHICLREPRTDSPRARWLRAAIPFLIALIAYFLANGMLIDKPVGHYELEATAFHPLALGSALARYAAKVMFFARFLSYPVQTELYNFLDPQAIGAIVVAGILAWYGYVLVKSRKLSDGARFGSFSFGVAVLLILPIAPLYFYYLQFSENDRYTYLAMPFFAMGLVWVLWNVRFYLGKVLIAVYLCFCLYFTHFMVGLWAQNHAIYTRVLSTFRWDSGTVYILNLPDNYRGTLMFRNIGGETALEEVLQFTVDRGHHLNIYEVMQYNMATPTDGVSVQRLGDSTFRVEFKQWGTWWWRDGIGGASYIHERYEVEVHGQFYDVTFNNLRPGDKVVYFDGERWLEVE